MFLRLKSKTELQVDRVAWAKPPVDIDVKVAIQCKNLILKPKRNFQIKSTGGFVQAAWSPCTNMDLPRDLTLSPGEHGEGDPVDADVVDAAHETPLQRPAAPVSVAVDLGAEVDGGVGAQVQDVVESGCGALGSNST